MSVELKNIFTILNDKSGVLTIILTVIGGIWAVLKFREHLKDKRFKTYHELIDELVNEQRQLDRKIKLDRQIAIVYELRNYPSYYPVTKRIMNGLKDDWGESNRRIISEINLTLEFINSNWFKRIWNRFRGN